MPRSQTPVVSWTLALAPPGLLPSGHCTPSAFPRCCWRHSLWTTTLPISGLHHAAYILVPSSFVRPWLGVHVDVTPALLARLCSGGTCACTLTHWGTATNCMRCALTPKVSGFPWRDQGLVRWGRVPRPGDAPPLPGRPAAPRLPPTPGTGPEPLQPPTHAAAFGYKPPPTTRRAGHRTLRFRRRQWPQRGTSAGYWRSPAHA